MQVYIACKFRNEIKFINTFNEIERREIIASLFYSPFHTYDSSFHIYL